MLGILFLQNEPTEEYFIYVYIEYMWYTLSVDSIYKKNIELLVILVGNSAEKLPRIYIS